MSSGRSSFVRSYPDSYKTFSWRDPPPTGRSRQQRYHHQHQHRQFSQRPPRHNGSETRRGVGSYRTGSSHSQRPAYRELPDFSYYENQKHLANWLCSLGRSYEQYRPVFESGRICAKDLFFRANDDVLQQCIPLLGHRKAIMKAVEYFQNLLKRNPLTWDSSDTGEFLCTLGVDYWRDSAVLRDYGFTISRLIGLCSDDELILENLIADPSHREAIRTAAVWICNPHRWTSSQVAQWISSLGTEYMSYHSVIVRGRFDGDWLCNASFQSVANVITDEVHRRFIASQLKPLNAFVKWDEDALNDANLEEYRHKQRVAFNAFSRNSERVESSVSRDHRQPQRKDVVSTQRPVQYKILQRGTIVKPLDEKFGDAILQQETNDFEIVENLSFDRLSPDEIKLESPLQRSPTPPPLLLPDENIQIPEEIFPDTPRSTTPVSALNSDPDEDGSEEASVIAPSSSLQINGVDSPKLNGDSSNPLTTEDVVANLQEQSQSGQSLLHYTERIAWNSVADESATTALTPELPVNDLVPDFDLPVMDSVPNDLTRIFPQNDGRIDETKAPSYSFSVTTQIGILHSKMRRCSTISELHSMLREYLRVNASTTISNKANEDLGWGKPNRQVTKKTPRNERDLCWDFLKGYCPRGSTCHWSHDQALAEKNAAARKVSPRIVAPKLIPLQVPIERRSLPQPQTRLNHCLSPPTVVLNDGSSAMMYSLPHQTLAVPSQPSAVSQAIHIAAVKMVPLAVAVVAVSNGIAAVQTPHRGYPRTPLYVPPAASQSYSASHEYVAPHSMMRPPPSASWEFSLVNVIAAQRTTGVCILLVGEGDFSFGLSLLLQLRSRSKTSVFSGLEMMTTSLDSRDQIVGLYGDNSESTLNLLESAPEVSVLHRVNARSLSKTEQLSDLFFDHIIWNFPHSGIDEVGPNISLVFDFMNSASKHLNETGLIWVTLCNIQPTSWCVQESATAHKLQLCSYMPFEPGSYPGYSCKRGHSNGGFPLDGATSLTFSKKPKEDLI